MGSPLGQKTAAETPRIMKELQVASRAASSQAARDAWQTLRAENSDAKPARPFAGRRRGQQTPQQAQPVSAQQAQADPR